MITSTERHRAAKITAVATILGVDGVVGSATALLREFIGTLDDVADIVVIPDERTIAGDPHNPGLLRMEADMIIQHLTIGDDGRRVRRGVRIVILSYDQDDAEHVTDITIHAPTVTRVDDVRFATDPKVKLTIVTMTAVADDAVAQRCSTGTGQGILILGYDCTLDSDKLRSVKSVLVPAIVARAIGDLHGDLLLPSYECVLQPLYGAVCTHSGGDIHMPSHVMASYCHDGISYDSDGGKRLYA